MGCLQKKKLLKHFSTFVTLMAFFLVKVSYNLIIMLPSISYSQAHLKHRPKERQTHTRLKECRKSILSIKTMLDAKNNCEELRTISNGKKIKTVLKEQ